MRLAAGVTVGELAQYVTDHAVCLLILALGCSELGEARHNIHFKDDTLKCHACSPWQNHHATFRDLILPESALICIGPGPRLPRLHLESESTCVTA